jgi:hypothetical protein
MAVDHERHRPHEYEDQFNPAPTRYDASGWGVILGVAALLAILGMLFIGIGSSPDSTAPQSTIERTAPTPAPAPATAPTPSTPAPATK